MSLFVCDNCHKRVRGKLETAYVGYVEHGTRWSRRIRLCPSDMTRLTQANDGKWERMLGDSEDEWPDKCANCAAALSWSDPAAALFVTVYRNGQDRMDFFAALCLDCGRAAIEQYELEPQPAGIRPTG